MSRIRKRSLYLFLIINISVITVSLIYNFLFEKNIVGSCSFHDLLGFYCPGCGGSRSLNALLSFNFIKSFVFYPAIQITSLIILYVDVLLFMSFIKNRNFLTLIRKWMFISVCAVIILNFIIRNILLLSGIDLLAINF
jgi:hypothetical protein